MDYVSQDFCQYNGHGNNEALQTGSWDTSRIELVCDIIDIPEPDASFDVILCSEVLEHIPDAVLALKEFARLLKPGGILILTAPFACLTHFAPYFYATGFSRHWYEYHLGKTGFEVIKLNANGNWYDCLLGEIRRIPYISRKYSSAFLGYIALLLELPLIAVLRILQRSDRGSKELMTGGWHVIAKKQ